MPNLPRFSPSKVLYHTVLMYLITYTGITKCMHTMPVQCHITYYTMATLDQYISLPVGHIAVFVKERVTGLGHTDVSALPFEDGLLLALFGMTFNDSDTF